MEYYAIINGVQVGPLDAESLLSMTGFSARTLVWSEEMTDWTPAAYVSEFAPRVSGYAEGMYPESPQYPRSPRYSEPPERPFNWVGWSVVNIIFGVIGCGFISTILGIIGLIYAQRANERYEKGDYDIARSAAHTAKVLNIIGLTILGIVLLLIIFVFAVSIMGFMSRE